jgi:membrane protein required for colicin V production
MTVFDYAVVSIIGLSVLISIMRGAIREVLSLIGWAASFFVAKTYASRLVPMLPQDIPTDSLKMLAAFVIIFLATLLITSLISIALSSILKNLGLGWLNRLLGGLFGFARGLLIVGVLIMLAGMTDLPKDTRWTNAMFSSPLEAMVKTALPLLPASITKYVKYD